MAREEIEPSVVSAGRRAKTAVGGKIATGNRLRDGAVVYWDGQDWTTDVNKAHVVQPNDEQVLKAVLDEAVKRNFIIDAAVVDTRPSDNTPARLREQIRAVGPTVRPDLARRNPL
jgi:hypothetical protein